MARFPNPRLVKIHRNFTVSETAETLKVHKNTVRAWLKSGLPALDERHPVLILGRDLRSYLESRRQTSKCPCPAGTMFCLKCRVPSHPAEDMVDYVFLSPKSGNLRGLCALCGTLMHRRVSRSRIAEAMPHLPIRFLEPESHLGERFHPSLTCAFQARG